VLGGDKVNAMGGNLELVLGIIHWIWQQGHILDSDTVETLDSDAGGLRIAIMPLAKRKFPLPRSFQKDVLSWKSAHARKYLHIANTG
jgi:hypothetical protein